MRLDVVGIVFRKELREMLRDRRSLAVMFGIPLLLYPLVAIGVASLGASKQKELTEQTARIVISDAESVPYLIHLMNDQYTGLTGVRVPQGVDLAAALKAGEVQAIIDVPPDAQARAIAGEDIELRTRIDRSRTSTAFVERKLNKMLDEFKQYVVEQRLAQRGVPPEVLKPVKTETVDIASGAQRLGSLLARALPLLLLMTGMLGALFPALNATTTERELGTLETLLVTPAGRTELLLAKGALVLVSGLLTALLNMVSMSLVLWRARSMIEGEAAAGLTVSPGALALTYLAAVPALILFSTVVLIVGLLARNFREANAFATPVMLLPLASLAAGIMEPAATPAVLVTPIANTTVIIREVLTGRASAGAFFLAFGSSAAYAGLMLSVAARLFSNEQLVNPAWEPLSLKGLKRGAARLRSRVPAPDEALALFGVSLLLLFYVTPSLRRLGMIGIVMVNQLLLVLAPALLFAWLGKWDWRQAFQWKAAPAMALAAAAMIGAGLVPVAQLVSYLQQSFWPRPPDDGTRATAELILDSLTKYPLLTIVLTGALAGFCEEMLFRGPVQTALARRLPPWAAIVLAALLFAFAHIGDLRGMPLRTALGVLLGWVVWRGRSIFPAMLLHALYDATALTIAWWLVQKHGPDTLDAEPAFRFDASMIRLLVAGVAMLSAGALLMRRSIRRPSANDHVTPAPDASPASAPIITDEPPRLVPPPAGS